MCEDSTKESNVKSKGVKAAAAAVVATVLGYLVFATDVLQALQSVLAE